MKGLPVLSFNMTYPAMIVDDGDLYKIIKKLNEYGCLQGYIVRMQGQSMR